MYRHINTYSYLFQKKKKKTHSATTTKKKNIELKKKKKGMEVLQSGSVQFNIVSTGPRKAHYVLHAISEICPIFPLKFQRLVRLTVDPRP